MVIERTEHYVSLTIDLPAHETLTLNAKAKAQGLSAEQYARRVLEHDLAPDWLRQSWASTTQNGLDNLSADEIDAEIAAARRARHEGRTQPGA